MTEREFIEAVRAALWNLFGVIMTEDDEEFAGLEFIATNADAETTARGIAADIHGVLRK